MGYFTQTELQDMMDNVKAAYLVVLAGGEEYSLNDGMGTMRTKRTSLTDLGKSMDHLQTLLDEYDNTGNIVSFQAGR